MIIIYEFFVVFPEKEKNVFVGINVGPSRVFVMNRCKIRLSENTLKTTTKNLPVY